jgi:3',5'-cyclic-AMP phosphodiesterase
MKISHITDPHIRPKGQDLYGLDPARRLAIVIDDINTRHSDAALVAITGDLTHIREPDAYENIGNILARLRMPVRLMLGNHDRRPAFRAAFSDYPVDDNGFVQSYFDAPGRIGRLLFLDSHEPGWVGGRMCAQRLGWLKARLDEVSDRPVTVFQHHPPLRIAPPHFDHICMTEPKPFLDMLRAHPGGVRHMFLGNIHISLNGTFADNLPFTAGRGCAHQIILDFHDPAAAWAAGVPNYNIIMVGDDDLLLHSFDMIGAELTATGAAPPGP